MTDFSPEPASNHPVPAYVATVARQCLAGLTGYLVGKGIIGISVATDIVAFGMFLLPMAWGLWCQHKNRKTVNDLRAAK